jgi:hypothetical protein
MRPRRRPRLHPLTAATLRRAHSIAEVARRLGVDVEPGVALLNRDYYAWRRRVARGDQPDSPRRRVVLP